MGIHSAGTDDLRESFAKGDTSLEEITQSSLDSIYRVESDLDAYITVMKDQAIIQAAEIDKRKLSGEKVGALAGTIIAIKDNIATKNVRTTCASKMLEDWIPVYDATVIEKLKQADAVIVGKTNMDEFAMGSSTEHSAFKNTKNPHDINRIPGGSSGGSAATVAAGSVTFSLGSDTGGSIRQPASMCGVVGVKPTYGRVSRYGLVAFGSSLDQIGPFARNVKDAAVLLDVISGHDKRDSTSIDMQYEPLVNSLERGAKGLRVGIISELQDQTGFDSSILQAVQDTASILEKNGAIIDSVSIPSVVNSLSAYYIIAPAEASSNLARFDGMRYGLRVQGKTAKETNELTRQAGFGDEVKRRIMLGTYALSAGYYDAYYAQALKVRTLMIQDFARAYEHFDILLAPTAPTTAFNIGELIDDPWQMYLQDICSIPTNLIGATAMSVPVSCDEKNLPIGIQIFAPPLKEDVLFQTAQVIESESEFNKMPVVNGF